MKLTRRDFAKLTAMAGGALMLPWQLGRKLYAQIPGGTLPPTGVAKYVTPLAKPPVMRRTSKIKRGAMKNAEYYEIAVKQFTQQILPNVPGVPMANHPQTDVWSYGPANKAPTLANGYFYPAFTLEAKYNKPTVVKWVNGLVDNSGNYRPHLLPVDQTLHWANPAGPRDHRGTDPAPYTGPVPMVTHVHGAHTTEESDGYAEAWYLPNANNIPGYVQHTTGTFFDYFNSKYNAGWGSGFATFTYPNDQPATTLWYHDHTLGMTRLNVYAGPAGYYLLRGGPHDMDLGYVSPGPGIDPFGEFTEIPIAIQDRSFNADGSLFYPDNRAFFEGLDPAQLQIPFIPDEACDGLPSDVSPIWNPEFFGNMMVVNGQTWPFLEVEQRRYRFRFLNGCNSRFLVLKMTTTPRMNNDGFNTPGHSFWQIGAEQGFLPAPVPLDYLLMAPAERADVIVDFSGFPIGTEIYLVNDGPDAPFGGIGTEDLSDWESTGQVMKFVVKASTSPDTTIPPSSLLLPAQPVLPATDVTREVSLNEEESASVRVSQEASGNIVWDCADGGVFGPTAALLGTYAGGVSTPLTWSDLITEIPAVGATEEWNIHNRTVDAHPIHVHQVKFKVLGRGADGTQPPESWEAGFKDTVIAYPGEITRIKANYDLDGFYVWHCHIVEHEDNEMMRPFHVGPIPPGAPAG
jgi:FtsP/CotA-like multicopper oxidase with cupredoxin domain